MSIFDKRVNYKPFEYGHITDPVIESIWASHWTHREFDFKSDIQDFKTKLTEEEQGVIKRASLMISQIEVAVKSFWTNIGKVFPKPEFEEAGATLGGNEVIHSKLYSRVLDVLGLNNEFEKMLEEEVIQGRVTYLKKYLEKVYDNDKKQAIYSVILFTLFIEGVSLFSQFYVILGFNRFKNVMKDLSNGVDYTSKEEQVHQLFGEAIVNQVRAEFPELFDKELIDRVQEEAHEALVAEENIIKWILQGYENEFLNEEILTNFVKHRINEGLNRMGFGQPFVLLPSDKEKFNWMNEEILASSLKDFFYKKPIDYAKNNKTFSEESLF